MDQNFLPGTIWVFQKIKIRQKFKIGLIWQIIKQQSF